MDDELDKFEPALAGLRRRGINISPATAWRWLIKGTVRGRKTPIVKIGGRLYTNQRMIDEFIGANDIVEPVPAPGRTSAKRQRHLTKIDAYLDQVLGINKQPLTPEQQKRHERRLRELEEG